MEMSWQSLTPAQVLVGLITLLSAFVIAFIGPIVIGRKITNLEDAANEATQSANDFSNKTEEIKEKFNDSHDVLNQSIEDLQATIIRLESEFIERADEEESPISETDKTADINKELRNTIRDDWHEIRNLIEKITKDPSIHGKTRNRLASMSRRNYRRILEELVKLKPETKFAPNFQALSIWNKYRANYKGTVRQRDVQLINELKMKLDK